MNKFLFCIVLLLFQISLTHGQWNFDKSVLNFEDASDCTCDFSNIKESVNAAHDSLKYKLIFHELLCHTPLSDEDFFSKLSLLSELQNTFRYWGNGKENFRFYLKHRKNIKKGMRIIFKNAYERALKKNDYLGASQFADRVFDNRPRSFEKKRDTTNWRKLELINYQKYAGDDFIKLIDFQKAYLLLDTSEVLIYDPPFKGYDYLLDLISKQLTSLEYETLLGNAVVLSKMQYNKNRARPIYWLNFKLREIEFNFHHEDLSRLYMPDTIVIDTFIDHNCYSNTEFGETIYMVNDTICNQIGDLNEMTKYKEKLKRTLLFALIRELKKKE